MRTIKENQSYHVKLFRLYDPEPVFVWEGNTTFHIQRRPNGDIGVLAVKDVPFSWAEYCHEDMEERDVSGYIECICEDYMMIICN